MGTRLVAPFAAALLLASLAATAQQSVYRWVDKDGKVQYTDTPPPQDAKSVTEKRMGGGYVEQEQPYAVQQAMKKNPVVLYSAAPCGEPCDNGKELLGKRGVPYTEQDPQKAPAAAEALKKLVGGLEVPVLVVGDNMLRGFDADQWNTALDGAGYPRTKLPGAPSR